MQPSIDAPYSGGRTAVDRALAALGEVLEEHAAWPRWKAVGTVVGVSEDIVWVKSLEGVQAEELLRFEHDVFGIALELQETVTGVVVLKAGVLSAGDDCFRTGKTLQVPVGEALLGRVVSALGDPIDGKGRVVTDSFREIERESPSILDRAPVSEPLATGMKVVDALVPIGRGQRELILGDRSTGKTSLAISTILNQQGRGVDCIYCSIGQQGADVARRVSQLERHGALTYTTVVVAEAGDPAGSLFVAPYASMAMAEYLMDRGRDVLVVFDDLTRHAWAYRQISLLLRRPPGREAFPADIFHLHARLLERSTRLVGSLGGGSITALPIVETEAENLSAYLPTNLISITDGQLYLSPRLFQQGILPAVDLGRSVSRVGAKAQLSAFRSVAGQLRLQYSQFEELESFARFGTRLDEASKSQLERGRRTRELLKQPEYAPVDTGEQVASLVALGEGAFDEVPLAKMREVELAFQSALRSSLAKVIENIEDGQKLSEADHRALSRLAGRVVRSCALEWEEG